MRLYPCWVKQPFGVFYPLPPPTLRAADPSHQGRGSSLTLDPSPRGRGKRFISGFSPLFGRCRCHRLEGVRGEGVIARNEVTKQSRSMGTAYPMRCTTSQGARPCVVPTETLSCLCQLYKLVSEALDVQPVGVNAKDRDTPALAVCRSDCSYNRDSYINQIKESLYYPEHSSDGFNPSQD